ncbi:MAG TPA: DedA family protein [Asanoa sp.]|jgi:membrane-associated protein
MAGWIGLVASPAWAYLGLLVLLVADAFVPVVPTQAIMITAGALTVYGDLSLPTTIAVGALGVVVGDWACYLLGRSTHDKLGPIARLRRRCATGSVDPTAVVRRGRARRTAAWLTRGFREPGPLVILLCRFVPGGRMAACFSAGRARYPYRLFLLYETAAAVGWAAYGGLVGHLGGTALTNSTWRLFAVAVTAATIFGAAGWLLALTGPGAALRRTRPATDLSPPRAASADAPPP